MLHQLTKSPFEPLKEASLKHLTFKTVFLLVLGLGKRHVVKIPTGEIYAWLFKNVQQSTGLVKSFFVSFPNLSVQESFGQGTAGLCSTSGYPNSNSFIGRSLKEDRSLCPDRTLSYYLDRTKDMRQGKDLVFVSLRQMLQ